MLERVDIVCEEEEEEEDLRNMFIRLFLIVCYVVMFGRCDG